MNFRALTLLALPLLAFTQPKADPCVDFYQYACGAWIAQNPLPADRARWARFNELAQHNEKVLLALTDPHSPGRYRVNGVLQNMPEFQKAFSCQAGQPMVSRNACRVW